jgi:hypothetical protein
MLSSAKLLNPRSLAFSARSDSTRSMMGVLSPSPDDARVT